jgi:hypothetical protein
LHEDIHDSSWLFSTVKRDQPRHFLPEGGRKIAQGKRSAVLGTRSSTRLQPCKGDVNSDDAFKIALMGKLLPAHTRGAYRIAIQFGQIGVYLCGRQNNP